MADRLQIKRDNAAIWSSINPVLSDGEFGFERDTNLLKIGNGVATWNALPYIPLTNTPTYLSLIGVAGVALGGHRVVIESLGGLYYADTTNTAHTNRVVGLTINACNLGQSVAYIKEGLVAEPSWAWNTSLPVWLSTNGLLTQAPSNTTGFTMLIGNPITSTSLYVSLKTPILL